MYVRLKFRKAVEGYRVIIFIDDKELSESYLTGSLKETQLSLYQWQEAYLGSENIALRLSRNPVSPPVSPNEIAAFAESLKNNFNEWLRTGDNDWQEARENLAQRLAGREDEICIVIDVRERDMLGFPWTDWDFLRRHCSNAEIALSMLNNHTEPPQRSDSAKVKVLVVVGKTDNIEKGIQADIEAIKELEEEEIGIIRILEQPSRHQVIDELRDQTYEIFIFTGHSGSDNNGDIGWIDLNNTDSLRLFDLKLALGKAIKKRLQICIFNSCDGLGLAKQLAELKLPLAIVMREPVPDLVAAKFLRVFLQNFSTGQSFFKSFHEAREQLEGFSGDYPGVCWLPTVSLCNLVKPPTWEELGGTKNPKQVAIPTTRENHGGTKPPKLTELSIWKWLLLGGAALLLLAIVVNKISPPTQEGKNISKPSLTSTTAVLPNTTKIKDVKPPQASGTMQYGGSTSAVSLDNAIRPVIKTHNPNLNIEHENFSGTTEGIELIRDNRLDFMFASTSVTILNITPKSIAKDAIAVVVNPNLPVQSLTKKNLADIITGKVTDWKDIPNANVTKSIPITVYYREDGGTTEFLTEALVKKNDQGLAFKKNSSKLTHPSSPLEEAKNKVKNDEGAIYFVTASESVDQCEFKPVPIINDEKKAVAPYEGQLTPRDANCATGNRNKVNIEAIKDGSYPIIRPIYLVLRNNNPAKQWGEFYLKDLQTDEGKKLTEKAGFAPYN